MALHLIGVKHKDQSTFPVALIIAENIHQLIAGSMNIFLCKLPKFLPGKNNIVSVHKKIFFPAGLSCPIADRTLRSSSHCSGWSKPFLFYGPEGSLKNRLKLLLLLIASAVGKALLAFSPFSAACPVLTACGHPGKTLR